MKVVFVSETGDSIGVAMKLVDEGHSVAMLIKDEVYRDAGVGEGIIPLGPAPTTDTILAEKPDLVVFDMVGFGELADAIRGVNVPVFGGSMWADAIELNRSYAMAVMIAADIDVPRSKSFQGENCVEDAMTWVRTHPETRWVIKPSGNLDTSLTYVSKSQEDCLAMLEHIRDRGYWPSEIVLQEFVDGVEVSTEGWFNGKEFISFNSTFEEKKFMEGNLGPNTGCQGNVVLRHAGLPPIVKEGIAKMEKILRASSYRGPLDLNTIATEKKLYGLEFTARFGYDAIQALLEGYRGSVGGLLHGIATGTLNAMSIVQQWLIGVRVTVPPYPHGDHERPLNVPVIGINDTNAKHVWPTGLKATGGKVIGTAPDGNLFTVTAWGKTLDEAKRRVYRTIENITVPNAQYRRDIGDRVRGDLRKLKEWGWWK